MEQNMYNLLSNGSEKNIYAGACMHICVYWGGCEWRKRRDNDKSDVAKCQKW